MANTTITPAAGALALASVAPPLFFGYTLQVNARPPLLKVVTLDIAAAQTGLQTFFQTFPVPLWWRAAYVNNRKAIRGNVLDAASNPLARTVMAFDETYGYRVGITTSDAVTGAFEILVQTNAPVIVIAVADVSDQRNNPILDRIVPI